MNPQNRALMLNGGRVTVGKLRGGGARPSWVMAKGLYEWGEIPNSAPTSATQLPVSATAGGSSGPQAKNNAWCGYALKTQGSDFIGGARGGHLDYAGNEVEGIMLNTETPAWRTIRQRSADADIISVAQFYLDLRPAATHTYYFTQFINSLNKFVQMPFGGIGTNTISSPWPQPPTDWPWTNASHVLSFNMAAGDWEAPDVYDPYPGTGDGTACLTVKHPVTEDVYHARGNYGGMYKFSATTGHWTLMGPTAEDTWYAGAAIDPVRNRMLLVGCYDPSSGPKSARLLDLNGSAISASFTGATADLVVSAYPAVAFSPDTDEYFALYIPNGGGDGKIHCRRIGAGSLFIDNPMIGTAPLAKPAGICGSAHYVPEMGIVVGTSTFTSNMWFFRVK